MHLPYVFRVDFQKNGNQYYCNVKADTPNEAKEKVCNSYAISLKDISRVSNHTAEQLMSTLYGILLQKENFSKTEANALSNLFAVLSTEIIQFVNNHPTDDLINIADRVYAYVSKRREDVL